MSAALFDLSFAGRSLAQGNPVNGITRVIIELGAALIREPTVNVQLTALGFGDAFVASVLALEYCPLPSGDEVFRGPVPNALLRSAASRSLAHRIASSRSQRQLLARGVAKVLRGLARPIDADVFHSTAYVGPPQGLTPGVRIVHTLYDLIPLSHPHLTTAAETASARAFVDSLRPDDWIVAISQWSADELRRLTSFPPDRVSVVPLAAASHFRVCSVDETAVLRSRFSLGDEGFLLALASRSPRKNVQAVVDAVERLGSAAPTLVIAGETTPEVRVRAEQSRADVRLVGDVLESELPALYSACTALVYPSAAEGFGLPPLEAMACGAPVIAARGTAVTELVDGAGILVELDDVDGLSRACEEVARDAALRRTLSRAGQTRAAAHSWTAAAELIADAYEAAAA